MASKAFITPKDLEVDLASRKESELFKWLLACFLFGKPIQQEVAQKAYFEFRASMNKEGVSRYPKWPSKMIILNNKVTLPLFLLYYFV